MTRYIDADALLKRLYNKDDVQVFDIHEFTLVQRGRVAMVIDEMSTADVQEVVRCKDCVHFCPYEVVEDFDGRCTARGGETDNDDFCNYGEKA